MKSDLKIKEKKLKLTTLGFTLVELLAVIVILAIIALIAIPLIGNVIEKAKIGALESSVNGLVESANMYYANETIKGGTIAETTFDFEDGEQIGTKKLEYKGKVYNGKLTLHSNGEVAVCIDDEEHYAYKNKDTDEIISGVGTCLYDGTTGDFSSNSPVEDLKQQIAAATATSDKVLEGNTIYTSVGLVAGTMKNNGSINETLTAGESYIIPEGYHDGTGTITAEESSVVNCTSWEPISLSYTPTSDVTAIVYVSCTATCSSSGHGNYNLDIQEDGTTLQSLTCDCNRTNGHDRQTDSNSFRSVVNMKAGKTYTWYRHDYSLNINASGSFSQNVYLLH